ncbi:MAG: hypothetical protein J6Y87_05135 [Muribaculaceae bacterium]|nr:hypothetical protein [Muribaculaceae bacterium]
MENDRSDNRKKWMASHPDLKTTPSMMRRKSGHDYKSRNIYLITICTKGRAPWFGSLQNADNSHPIPWVLPSELGIRVISHWLNIAVEQPLINNVAFQLMPDHIHGILFITETLPRHLGHYISRFKAKCTKDFRDMSEYSETQSRTENLWESCFNDRILMGKGQLKDWANYLYDNPRRLWVKRHHPDLFTARRGIVISNTSITIMGNHFLLDYPCKVAVKCSRRMTEQDIELECNRYLSLAKNGAVLVSPCISKGEKSIMRRVFDNGYPEIIILDNGFSPMQKPAGRQFDACAQGRLLLVSQSEYNSRQRGITRKQCMSLNRLADEIMIYETTSRITPTC